MIDIKNLTKHYRNTPATTDLTFTAHNGRITGFLTAAILSALFALGIGLTCRSSASSIMATTELADPSLTPTQGLLVMTGWTTLALTTGWATLTRKDI